MQAEGLPPRPRFAAPRELGKLSCSAQTYASTHRRVNDRLPCSGGYCPPAHNRHEQGPSSAFPTCHRAQPGLAAAARCRSCTGGAHDCESLRAREGRTGVLLLRSAVFLHAVGTRPGRLSGAGGSALSLGRTSLSTLDISRPADGTQPCLRPYCPSCERCVSVSRDFRARWARLSDSGAFVAFCQHSRASKRGEGEEKPR